jgi:hypothetical protein
MTFRPDVPAMAISVMQPWAWLIVNRHKDIENRDWATKFRGPVAIHAGKKLDEDCAMCLTYSDGAHHPVTGRNITIDTGQRLISSNRMFDTWSAPAWHNKRGGIVGIAEVVDCVDRSDSEWFVGKFGFVLANQQPIEFIQCPGALGFFDWRKKMGGVYAG